MLNMKVRSTDNTLNYDPNENTYQIKEILSVQIDYYRTVEDMQAYNDMVRDLVAVLMKHCSTTKLPFTAEQIEAMFPSAQN